MGFLSKAWNVVKDAATEVVKAHVTFITAGANYWGPDLLASLFKLPVIPDMRRDRELMVSTATSSRRIVYGRTRVGGNLVYAETSGKKNAYLNIIVVFTSHAITGYDEIWFNDQLAATVSGGVVTVTAGFSGFVTIELHDGTQTTASTEMLAQTHGNWTANHKLLGCAYGYFRLKYNESKYAAGIPAVKAVMRGKEVYDPRTTITGWSDNPALCISDYMRTPGIAGGMGCSADEVPTDSVIAAADICDQTIAGADNEKRYTLNGLISLDQTPANILKPMLSAMSGQALYSGGEWTIYAGAPSSTVATLDESWLNGGISFSTGSNKGDLINTAKGVFTNPNDHWADTEFPTVINETYLAADYEELTADLPMPFTTSQTMAQRLATIEIEKSRRGMVVNYPCNLKAAHLGVMDVVAINNDRLGWDGKLFRIMSWGFSPMGGVDLALVEYDAGIWADPSAYGVLAPPPMTNLPDPWTVLPPTNIVVTESLRTLSNGSGFFTQVEISWDGQDDSAAKYQVFMDGLIQTTTVEQVCTVIDVAEGEHLFSVVAINALGSTSDPLQKTEQILGKTARPANVQNMGASATSFGGLVLSWDAVADVDLLRYEVRYCSAQSGAWESAISVGSVSATTITIPAALDGLYLVKAVDTGLRESTDAARVITTIPSLANYNAVEIIDDGDAWPGEALGAYPLAGKLFLDMAGQVDTLTDWDAWQNIDTYGGAVAEGYYTASETVNLGSVQTSRCAATVLFSSMDTSSLFDSVEFFDSIPDFDGVVVPGVLAQPQIRTSADGVAWTSWQSFVAGDYTAQYLQFRLKLSTTIPTNVPVVSQFSVSVDMPDRAERGKSVAVGTAGANVLFAKPYMEPPIIRTTIQGATSGDTEKITNATTTGFTIQVLNSGSGVARVVDWQSVGY